MNTLVQKHTGDAGREAVAIVGMACVFPKAPDLQTFWRNIIQKVDAVTDVPPGRWNPEHYYDPKSTDGSKIYARRGGYLDSPMAFDAAEFGIMPKAVLGGEPDQFLVLKTAAQAMLDAGIPSGAAPQQTDFILGRGSYLSAGAFNLVQRSFVVDQTVRLVGQMHPGLSVQELLNLKEGLLSSLQPFAAESAPSVMPNITAGRVANRLGFMGPNYTIDAACASSLFAVEAAVANLQAGRSDLALAGGVHIFNNIPFLSVFCALGAMSRQDQIRPFDKDADGLLPGEGVGIVVLKRRVDAERDGNRIYALIRGIGSSSDGRGGSVAAPRVAGEVLALTKAYRAAGLAPGDIELIEAHGTATLAGDAAEIESLTTVFGSKQEGTARNCALGSVKSMIGHAMPAAGIAGLIKTVLALHHKVLPPTLHCDAPNPKFKLEQSPFYINTETRPWFRMGADRPRRAGVNAFGFGGVNAHVVLEEYGDGVGQAASGPAWDAALFLFSGETQADLAAACMQALATVESTLDLDFLGWSAAIVAGFKPAARRLAIIAESSQDLAAKLRYATEKLKETPCKKIKDIKGIYYFAAPLGAEGKVAFMFPGEGSPYTNMLLDLCLHFPEVRAIFEEINTVIAARTHKSRFLPSQFIFPATLLSTPEQERLAAEFWSVDTGLQAILAASLAMNALLARFGVNADMIVGHSAGEYSAWMASGILQRANFYRHQEQIAAIYAAHPCQGQTAMVAVAGGLEKIKPIVESIQGQLYISNDNCPHQVVVVGDEAAMVQLTARLKDQSILYTDLPSREVHHTPMAAHQADPLFKAFSSLDAAAPRVPVYSAITAEPYPSGPDQIVRLMVDYWLQPLRFRQTIEAMYRDGARIFIEVGPGTNLSGFVDDTLRGRPSLTVSANSQRRSGIAQLCHLLGMLVAMHVPVRLEAYAPAQSASAGSTTPKASATTLHLDLGLTEMRLTEADQKHWQNALNAKTVMEAKPVLLTQALSPATMPVEQAAPVVAPPSAKAQVMEKYLDNMAQFLSLQKEIMARQASPKAAARPAALAQRPFVGHVTALELGKACQVRRTLDLKQDLFLLDHPFGGPVSDSDPTLLPLIVSPLTLNVEIMAEAASLIIPDKVLLEIKAIKAHRWVEVDEQGGAPLQVQARLTAESFVNVRLFDGRSQTAPSAEAAMLFGAQYPPSTVSEPASIGPIAPDAALRARDIYAQKWMFHGPHFQVIAGWTQVNPKEVQACLRAPAEQDLFASIRAPHLLVNPLLLDACAQLTGYWAQKELKEKFITFPAGVQSIRFFSAAPQPGELLQCRMRIQTLNDHLVESDLDITFANGRQWASVKGWTHRRFELPLEYYHFWRFPKQNTVSQVLADSHEEKRGSAVHCRMGHYEQLNNTIWKKAVGMLYLNRAERRLYQEKLSCGNGAHRFLTERMVAKDAVRLLLGQCRRPNILPADIGMADGPNGQQIPSGSGLSGLGGNLKVSVAHTEQFAQAHATLAGQTSEQEKLKHA